MKNKKLYIIILAFIFVIIIMYIFYIQKTEAPTPILEYQVKDNINLEEGLLAPQNPIAIENGEKYKIISRSVIVPEDVKNKRKVVLLTIDDGPTPRTKEVIGILKNHNAKAIFFVNGMNDNKNTGVIEEINKEGFAVGNHTWSHMNLKQQKDVKKIENEINKTTELVKKLTLNPPRFFRAPYGESNQSIRKLVKDGGMLFMDWSGAAKDWDKKTADKEIFIGNVMSNVHSGSIILLHEHPWSVANLDALLTKLESEGYTYIDPKDIIE